MVDNALEVLINRFNVQIEKRGPSKIHGANRTIFAKFLNELGVKVGAEVGVAQGWHAEILCREIPNLKLYAIDVWEQYEGYREYENKIDKYYKHALDLLAPYNVEFIKKFSMDAVKDFEDKSLDFVFIDGAHDFKNVAMDIYEWSKKVKVGGIVYGHDYKRWKPGLRKPIRPVHVKDVAQAYMYSMGISPWFELCIDVKDDKFNWDTPCWAFVRQEKDWIFV